jgi:DNA polymerase-3 subunit gamma/tau
MFTGARGVGKTSTARILAKALNCPNVVDGVPCNKCEICEGISAGNDVDVLEIDGASHRGIDDIRSLRANVGVRSMRTQYKVYIIDEVHMLTKEAFNALLKTLEEPPPNVKFVFCTTEPNKVPDTILSRCQRFDFSSITDRSIGDRLRDIAKIEGFEVSEDALELVARRARGSMRDSQSLFDQLLAFSDGTVSSDDVHRMLGTAGDERLTDLFDAIIEHRPGEVLAQLDAAFGTGVQPSELMDQSIGYVRDLIVTLSGGTEVPLCSVATRHREKLMNQATRLGMHSVMAAFQILSDARNQMFRSTFARIVLEMAMVQISLLENLTAISDLLSGRLPALLDVSSASASPTTGQSSVGTTTVNEKKNSEPRIVPAVTLPIPDDVLPELDDDDGGLEDDNADDIVEAPAATESESAPAFDLNKESCRTLLEPLVKSVGLKISAGLSKASDLVLVAPNRIEIVLESSFEFARKVLDQPENRARIESELRNLTGQSISVQVRLVAPQRLSPSSEPEGQPDPRTPVATTQKSGEVSRAGSGAASKQFSRPASAPAPVQQRNILGEVDPSNDPFVRQVIAAFGGTVVKVTVAPSVRISDSELSSS